MDLKIQERNKKPFIFAVRFQRETTDLTVSTVIEEIPTKLDLRPKKIKIKPRVMIQYAFTNTTTTPSITLYDQAAYYPIEVNFFNQTFYFSMKDQSEITVDCNKLYQVSINPQTFESYVNLPNFTNFCAYVRQLCTSNPSPSGISIYCYLQVMIYE